MGLTGDRQRWRTMHWMVGFFGILVDRSASFDHPAANDGGHLGDPIRGWYPGSMFRVRVDGR